MDDYSDYWQKYWESHNNLDNEDPQKQVARTKFGIPILKDDWNKTCEHILTQIKADPTDTLLDVCCGNGLLSAYLIDYVHEIYAIDYSKKLFNNFVVDNDRIIKVFSDVQNFDYKSCHFNRVIMYFAAQHFNESFLLSIVKKIYENMMEGGLFLIGDIPDIDRKWGFFNRPEFREFYFSNLEKAQPAIGTWYDKLFFKYLAEYIGFRDIIIQDQPQFMLNSSHRFDVILKK